MGNTKHAGKVEVPAKEFGHTPTDEERHRHDKSKTDRQIIDDAKDERARTSADPRLEDTIITKSDGEVHQDVGDVGRELENEPKEPLPKTPQPHDPHKRVGS